MEIEKPKSATKKFGESLMIFGQKLSEWAGKEVLELSDEAKDAIDAGKAAYIETKEPVYLLVFFIVQNLFSSILSKRVFSEFIFNKKFEYPEQNIQELGNLLIVLGKAIQQGREKTLDNLLATLLYAYDNDLLLVS
jgi:hypothetical protein